MSRSLRVATRRGLALAAATGIALFGAGMIASPAQATHGALDGSVECDKATGTYTVNFALTNKWAASGELKNVKDGFGDIVEGKTLPAGTGAGAQNGAAETPGSLTASKTLPGNTKESVTLKVTKIKFSNGHVSTAVLEKTLELSGDCAPETKPESPKPEESPKTPQSPVSATLKVSCDSAYVELVNPKNKPADFNLYLKIDDADFVKATSKTVAAGETESGEVKFADYLNDAKPTKVLVEIRAQGAVRASGEWTPELCETEPSPEVSPAVEESAQPSVSPAAEGGLPVTGSSVTGLMIAGAAAVGLGIAGVVLARRRKQA